MFEEEEEDDKEKQVPEEDEEDKPKDEEKSIEKITDAVAKSVREALIPEVTTLINKAFNKDPAKRSPMITTDSALLRKGGDKNLMQAPLTELHKLSWQEIEARRNEAGF